MLPRIHLFFAIVTLPFVRAGWDDFANNLATDLAPFLSLFGEQITKQYLSESTTPLDYFIFAMAPMGILTAVVSAIRVCGSPSLRAFIGRAQEGGGNAEAELCSSTSRDVCELYNNGGIARVFGRPKILEVVYDPDYREPGTAGIYTFQEYLDGKGKDKWYRCRSKSKEVLNNKPRSKEDAEVAPETDPARTAFSPNLSLNIGIKKQPPAVFWAVGIGGLMLQVGVLVFAGIATYYLQWEKDGRPPDSYACPLVLIGTVLLCGGMFLCSFVVGQSTDEEVWRRRGESPEDKSSVYWVQPGGQIVGDQTFDAFSHSDDRLREYTTSWKSRSKDSELTVWAAIGITISGFILQFTGLRGIHSAVSIAQLGVTIAMSAVRSALRMQRLKPDANWFAKYPDEVIGHELDWLALRIGRGDIEDDLDRKSPASSSAASLGPSSLPSSLDPRRRHFWRFRGIPSPLQRISKPSSSPKDPNAASKVLSYRTRLAELTGLPTAPSRNFKVEMVEVRREAQQLAEAIESAVNIIFSMAEIRPEWKDAESILWGVNCSVLMSADFVASHKDCTNTTSQKEHLVHLQLQRTDDSNIGGAPWILQNKLELEGLLGLWVWSLKSDPKVETEDPQTRFKTSRATDIPLRRIVSSDRAIVESDLRMWCPNETYNIMEHKLCPTSPYDSDASTIWKRTDSAGNTGNTDKTSKTSYEPFSNAQLVGPVLIHPHSIRPRLARFFGWHAADLSQEQAPKPFSVWSAPPTSSLLSLCAQDVFGSFIKCILGIVDDIGEIEIQESHAFFCLENGLVSEIVRIFMEKRLGPRDEALLCILPPVISMISHSQARVPSAATALAAARKSANQHRRRKDWDKAQAVLRWAWGICDKSQHSHTNPINEASTALGELYRWALMDEHMRQFGTRGIEWLAESGRSQSLPAAATAIIERYEHIAKVANGQETNTNTSNEVFLSGIRDKDLTATLLHLTGPTSITSEEKGAALCVAASHGWAEVVLALLEIPGTHPDFKDSDSRTALSHAAEAGSVDTVNELIGWGAFSNSEDVNHRTPLMYAAHRGRSSVVEILLRDPRVSPDVQDKDRRTPLWWAAEGGSEGAVRMLLATGRVDTEAHKGLPGGTPLLQAASLGHEAVVKLLLANDMVNPNARDDERRTPLSCAAQYGREAVVRLLLADDRVDPDVRDKNKRTPLLLATIYGHEAVVRQLIATGRVDLEAKDNGELQDRTPLSWAAAGGHEGIVKLLMATGKVDLDWRAYGRTPLSFAAEAGSEAVAKLLLATGKVDPDSKDRTRETPLSRAAKDGHEQLVRLFLAIDKVDPDSKDLFGLTPLSRAAGGRWPVRTGKGGWDTVVELLLATGKVDADAKDRQGQTPLWNAAVFGYETTVKLLLATGNVDPNAGNVRGETPLSQAVKYGHTAVVEMLESYLASRSSPNNASP